MTEKGNTKIVPTTCCSHCGGTCILRVHVKEGVIARIDADENEAPMFRACLRGRAQRQRVYAPDRLLYPLKRVGNRGEGKYERISWDEALDRVAFELKRVKEAYGPMSILYLHNGGDLTSLHTTHTFARLLGMAGGFTTRWGGASFHGGLISAYYTYGTVNDSGTRDDLLNSKLIILWGWDPAVTVAGPSTRWILTKAREKGIRIVVVDPHYSDSAVAFADEWIPIRPGTDAAMLIAMANVIIRENLQDQRFLDTHAVGFDKYKDYVLGIEDGLPKTPAWAEAITGVSFGVIEKLARLYASTKPAALRAGIAPGRTAFGEQYHRAAIALAVITGNVGIHGGDSASRAWESVQGGYPFKAGYGAGVSPFPNPLEEIPSMKHAVLPIFPRIHYTKMADAILKGKAGGYPADYKMAVICNSNYVVSEPNSRKAAEALKSLEFSVILEHFMTPTAKCADVILPTTTFLERNDIASGVGMPYYGFQNQAIEPLGECKSHNEIAKELAARMGIAGYDEESEDGRLRNVADRAGIPDYATFKKSGLHVISDKPYVVFEKQIADPTNNPFPTPSGKIELYSQQIADLNDPLFPPIPKYIEPWEGIGDPLAKKYPVQLITNHAKTRALAQFDNIPWARELNPQAVSINSRDASVRRIQNGDNVRVFNDRGEVRVVAHVTNRVMPGVAILPSGAWFDPDSRGVDRGGCANVLTKDERSPGGAFPYNTCLVQIDKVDGE